MPPSNHLQRTRIDRFDGIWDSYAPNLLPANAAQVMSGCHPQPGGGLRAFYKPTVYLRSDGMDASVDPFRVLGIYKGVDGMYAITADVDTTITARTKAPRPPADNLRGYYATIPALSNKYDPWNNATATFNGAALSIGILSAEVLTTVPILSVSTAESSTPDQFMCLNASTNSYNGIWDMDGGTFTFHDTVGTIPHPIGIQSHQSRLVAQFGSSIIFTAPGVYDIPTGSSPPNFVNFGESEVRWLVAVPPSDLLVGTRSGGVYNVQGDLSDPIVRTLVPPGNALYSRCQAYLSSAGPVVWRSTGPTVINTDGQATPLARNLSYLHFSQNFTDRPDDALGSTPLNGTFGQLEQFLFVRSDGLLINRTAANDSGATTDDPTAINDWVDDNILHLNGPLVFDTETGAWFRATHPDVADLLSPSHNVNIDGILLSICSREFEPEGDEPLAYAFRPSARSWKYTWRSAPLHTKSGRTVDLEEVQIGAYGHVQPIHTLGDDTTLSEPTEGDTASTTSTLVVTATNEAGNTKSTTVTVPPGPHVLTVPLKLRGTYVDVTVTASSAHRIIEAPTIEYIEFGWTEGHVKRQT